MAAQRKRRAGCYKGRNRRQCWARGLRGPGEAQRAGRGAHLQPDLLIDEHRAVAEGDGIAEAGLPLDGLVAEVHEDLGALGVRVEEEWCGRESPAGQRRRAVLLLVVASVRGDREGAPDGVCKGTNLHVESATETPRAAVRGGTEVAHGPGRPPSSQRTHWHLLAPSSCYHLLLLPPSPPTTVWHPSPSALVLYPSPPTTNYQLPLLTSISHHLPPTSHLCDKSAFTTNIHHHALPLMYFIQ